MAERLVLTSDDKGEYAACQNHVHHVFNSKLLANMFGSLPFQDVTLEFLTPSGGVEVEVKANGTILALSSEYFYHELSKGIQRIAISHVAPEDLESIIKFLHTGTIEIGEDNYQRLYRTASTFTFPRVKQKCMEYLAQTITNENWIDRHHFGYVNKSEFLMGSVTSFVKNDVALHLKSRQLVSMPCEELNRILTFAMDPQYSPVDDGEVLIVIVKWLEFENRFAESEQEADELLNMVDMDLVKESHVQEIVRNTVMLQNFDFVKLLFEVIASEETKTRWFCHLPEEVQMKLALLNMAPANNNTALVEPENTGETFDTNHSLVDILSTSTSPGETGSLDSSSSSKVAAVQSTPSSAPVPSVSVSETVEPTHKLNTSSALNTVSTNLASVATDIGKPKSINRVAKKSTAKPPVSKNVSPGPIENDGKKNCKSVTTSDTSSSSKPAKRIEKQTQETNANEKNIGPKEHLSTINSRVDLVSSSGKRKRSESFSDEDDFITKKPKRQAAKTPPSCDDKDYSEGDESSEDDSASKEGSDETPDRGTSDSDDDDDDDDFDPSNLSRRRTRKPFIRSDDEDESPRNSGSGTGSESTIQSGLDAISESVHSRDTDASDSHPSGKQYLIYLRYNEKRETSIMYTDLCMAKPRCLGKFKGLNRDASLLWVPTVRKLYLLGGVEHDVKPDPDPASLDPTVIDRWSVVQVRGISEKVLFKEGVGPRRPYPCANMITPRTRFSPVFLDGYIYAIGGGSGQNCNESTNLCERLLVCGSGKNKNKRHKWEICEDFMNQARCHHAANVINNVIFVCGGYGTEDDCAENKELEEGTTRMGIENTAERYDPLEDKWTFVTKMSTYRAGCCSVALNGKLYVFGGGGAKLHTKHEEDLPNRRTAEVYDPEENCWTKFPDMVRPRLNGSAVVLNGVIYAVGGDCHKDSQPYAPTLSSVERYDPITQKWHLVTEELDKDGNFNSVAVITRR